MNLLSDVTSKLLLEMIEWFKRNVRGRGRGEDTTSLAPGEGVPVANTGESAANIYSLVKLGPFNDVIGGQVISHPESNSDPLAVLIEEAPAGGPSYAWADFKPHPLAVADNSAMSAGDRLGVDPDGSYNAVADESGPFQVLSIPTDSTTNVEAVRLSGVGGGDPVLRKVTRIEGGKVYSKAVDDSGDVTGDEEEGIDASGWGGA